LNYWELTRNSAVVLKGTVKNVNAHVTLTVSLLLKGEMESATVKFATPKILEGIKFVDCFPRAPRFAAGKQYLVFLNKNEAGEYVFVDAVMDNLIAQAEQSIRDLQRFENLDNDVEKCKMLVSLMLLPHKGLRSGSATQEIYQFNKAEFLELLEPLVDDPITKVTFVSLLGDNPNPKTTDRLMQLLNETKQEEYLYSVITALKQKKPEDINLSRELLKYIKHESPKIRRNVIFVLTYRGFTDAVPEVSECLEDEHPEVRAMALYYLKGVQKNEEVLEKIKKLRNDSNEHVRAAVYRALPLRVSSFYEFLRVSLLDSSRHVRGAAGRLDLIFERRPIIILLLLLWPGIVMSFIIFYVLKIFQCSRPGLTVVIGVTAGYIAGALAGYLTGKYNSTASPLACAVILIPPLFLPISILLSGAVNKYGKRIPFGLLFLSTIILCVIIHRITLGNTLWPSMLAGVFVMAGIICLSDFSLKKISPKTNDIN